MVSIVTFFRAEIKIGRNLQLRIKCRVDALVPDTLNFCTSSFVGYILALIIHVYQLFIAHFLFRCLLVRQKLNAPS